MNWQANALVEKTRTFVQQKTETPAPVFDSAKEVEPNELNKALGQVYPGDRC